MGPILQFSVHWEFVVLEGCIEFRWELVQFMVVFSRVTSIGSYRYIYHSSFMVWRHNQRAEIVDFEF